MNQINSFEKIIGKAKGKNSILTVEKLTNKKMVRTRLLLFVKNNKGKHGKEKGKNSILLKKKNKKKKDK